MTNPSRGVLIPLLLIGLIALGLALIEMKIIIMPLVVAFFLSNLAGPPIALLKKIRIPTGFAIIIIILFTAVVIFCWGRSSTSKCSFSRRKSAEEAVLRSVARKPG